MVELKNASFRYRDTEEGVQDISLSVYPGTCVVLTGVSGCGKTTVTRMINGLAPAYYPGDRSGTIAIDGKNIDDIPVWQIGETVGSVFQDPKSQFFSSELNGEVAFACENYGFDRDEILRRTDRAITVMELEAIRNRPLDVISSGEKQRTAIASVYALQPKIFVCDEPTANLDQEGIEQLKRTFAKLKAAGHTLIIAEHRIAWLNGIADRYLYIANGRIIAQYTPAEINAISNRKRREMGLRVSVPIQIPNLPEPNAAQPARIRTKLLCCRRGQNRIWTDLNFVAHAGYVTALTGINGAGKTTLALVLSGLAPYNSGTIYLNEEKADAARLRKAVYYCSNDTGTQFFTDSVSEELLLNLERNAETLNAARGILKRMRLYNVKDSHPAVLSGGQKQRLAIACGLLSGRDILIFDEPTSGLDGANMRLIATELKSAACNGKTVVVISHDAELISACCDFRIHLGTRITD